MSLFVTNFYKNNLAVLPIAITKNGDKYEKQPTVKGDKFPLLKSRQCDGVNFREGTGYGIGIFCGLPSENLEALDFDTKYDLTGTLWEDFVFRCEMADIDLSKYLIVQTISKGYHIYYRCEVIQGNSKIAHNADGDAIIETRGEGGWVVAPPTNGYAILQGGYESIPTITKEERALLWLVCESFDCGKKAVEPKKSVDSKPITNDNSPFVVFNSTNPLPMLEREGWKVKKGGRGETIYLVRPGSNSKTPHATLRPVGDTWLFHCFSSNGYPFEMKSYNPVGIYQVLTGIHDKKELGKALAGEGFGEWREASKQPQSREIPKIEKAEVVQGDFPLHVFPTALQGFINEYAEKENLDKNCLALCVLGAFSTAIGLNYALEYENGYKYYASFYGAMVGNSAVGKSPILKLAYAPLYDLESQWYKEYKEDLASWKRKNSAKGGTEEEQPTRKRCIVEDSTIESVLMIMQENQKGLGMTHDELAGWLSSFNKYRNGAGGDGKRWLEMWSNNRVSKDRVSGSLFVPKGYCTIVGGIQPTEMGELVKGSFANDGFFFRFLFAFASKNRKVRTWQEMKQRTTDGRTFLAYKEAVQKLAGEPQEEEKVYRLTGKEEEYWAENWFNPYQRENETIAEQNPAWSSVLTKMSIYCSRFQLLLQLIHEAYGEDQTGLISMEATKGAIELANYFKDSFKVATSMAQESQSEQASIGNSKAESVNWAQIFGDDIELQRKEIVERLQGKYGASERSAIRWIANALKKSENYGYWTYL